MPNLSRRDFLKLGGLSLAVTMNPLSQFAIQAQDESLSIQTWGHFISTTNEQLSEQLNLWSTITDISLDVSFTGFEDLATSLEESDETQTPDIIMMLHARPHQFADNLMDVSDIAEAVGRANGGWYNIAREACEVDGVWRAMPWFFAPQAMVYRSDLYAEAGYDAFPSTMEELLEAGTTLKTMEYPLGFSVGPADGDGNNFCLTVLWSFGGNIVNPDNEIVLDSPETRLALEFVQQLYQDAMLPEVVSWDDGANNTAFLAGEISTTNNASSILWAAQQNDVAFASTINHASYPEGPAGSIQYGQVHSFGILNHTQNVDAAKSLLTFLNSVDVWLPMGSESFGFNYPLFRNFEDLPSMAWNLEPQLLGLREIVASAHTAGYPAPPSAAASQVISDFVITDMFASVCNGDATIDEAIQTAVTRVEDLYDNA